MSGATSGPLILVSCVMVRVVVFLSVNSGEQSDGFAFLWRVGFLFR